MTQCQHYEKIDMPEYGKHMIGRCVYCGHTRNYTLLQEQDAGYRQAVIGVSKPDTTLERMFAVKKPRGRPSKYG